jgi:hypothetical protein
VTADEWAGEEYRQQRPKGWCGINLGAALATLLTAVFLVRKGRTR